MEEVEEMMKQRASIPDPLDFSTVEDGGVEGEVAEGLPMAEGIESEEKEKKKGMFHWLKNSLRKGNGKKEEL